MVKFCNKIFPDLAKNIGNQNWIEGRALLAPTNKKVQMMNDILSSKLPGSTQIMRSSDQLEKTEEVLHFNLEYLNSLTPSNCPPHAVHLKKGTPLMHLRNLDPRAGLCNGTKLIFEDSIDNNKPLQGMAPTECPQSA